MASRPLGPSYYALGLCARALIVATAAVGAVTAEAVWRLDATCAALAIVALVAFVDLRATVLRADQSFRTLVESLASGELDGAGRRLDGHRSYSQAIGRVLDAMLDARTRREAQIDRLHALLDSVPAALFILANSGPVELPNRAARRLAGIDAVRLEDMAAVGAAAAAVIRALPAGGRRIVRIADGRQMLCSALRFSGPRSPPERLVALQDIAVDLDAVEVRAWQDLVRVLAHEMLNSLTPISALAASLSQRDDLDSQTAEAIEVIARRSSGLTDFVDRYRKVAEMPTPIFDLISLDAVLADLDRLVRPEMAAVGVRFECAGEEPGLAVQADRQLLDQAMINLVKNARDAVAGRSDAAVAVSWQRLASGVAITVRDNGPGVPPDLLDRLFVPFFSTKAGGSGIGLTLARQIALAHDGQLEAGGAPSGGAAFTLTLPIPDRADRPVLQAALTREAVG